MGRRYRAGEVAELAGVTVRTLHHYDRIGLLSPSARSAAGYRLYAEADLLRLQHIVTLRAFGFGLDRIARLLGRPALDLAAALTAQRLALRRRVDDLEGIDAALGNLLAAYRTTGDWDWPTVVQTAAAVSKRLSEGATEMESYYTAEQLEGFRRLGERTPKEEIAAIEQGWADLLAEVRANRDLDPASPPARKLADRWEALMARLTEAYRDEPDLWRAIGDNSRRGAFEGYAKAPQAEDFAFIERVKAARG